MIVNEFNEYKIEDKSDIYNIIIKFSQNDENNNYNKLGVFILDKNKNYILQEIIDINDIKRKNIDSYLFNVNKNIYFIPLKNITTCLYSIE